LIDTDDDVVAGEFQSEAHCWCTSRSSRSTVDGRQRTTSWFAQTLQETATSSRSAVSAVTF